MRVLQLYNVFGAMTERTMLAVPLALAARGVGMSVAHETLDDDAPNTGWPMQQVPRIAVQPTTDTAQQMLSIAEQAPACPGPFDLVHGHFGPRILHAVRYLHRGVPTVISCYGYDVSRLLRDPCWAHRYAWAGRRGAVFVVLSDAMRQTLLACGVPDEQVRIIRLGIVADDWRFDPQPAAQPDRFVFIGRFTGKKAPQDVIAALPDGARLDMVGGGELEDSLRAQVAAHAGLAARVCFLGRLPLDELPGVLRGATAFVLPSVTAPDGDMEGMPMILMQALAAGVPCITTAHAGNPEVIPPDDRGLCVVPESDIAALRQAMRRVAALNAERRGAMQRRGRDWVERKFLIERTVDAYADLYRGLVAGR